MTLSPEITWIEEPRAIGSGQGIYAFPFTYEDDTEILVEIGESRDFQQWEILTLNLHYTIIRGTPAGGQLIILDQALCDSILAPREFKLVSIKRNYAYQQETVIPTTYSGATTDLALTRLAMQTQQLADDVSYLKEIPGIASSSGTVHAPNERGRIVCIDNDEGTMVFKGSSLLETSTSVNSEILLHATGGLMVTGDSDLRGDTVVSGAMDAQSGTISGNFRVNGTLTAPRITGGIFAELNTIACAILEASDRVETVDLFVTGNTELGAETTTQILNAQYIWANEIHAPVGETLVIGATDVDVADTFRVGGHIENAGVLANFGTALFHDNVVIDKLMTTDMARVTTLLRVDNLLQLGEIQYLPQLYGTEVGDIWVTAPKVTPEEDFSLVATKVWDLLWRGVTAGRLPKFSNNMRQLVDSPFYHDTINHNMDLTYSNLKLSAPNAHLEYSGITWIDGTKIKINPEMPTEGYALAFKTPDTPNSEYDWELSPKKIDKEWPFSQSGILDGLEVTKSDFNCIDIAAGKAVAWNGTEYEVIELLAQIEKVVVPVQTDMSVFVVGITFLDGSYHIIVKQLSAITTIERVSIAWRARVIVERGEIQQIENWFYNLTQPVATFQNLFDDDYIDCSCVVEPITGRDSFRMSGGIFTSLGIHNIPATRDKYLTNHMNIASADPMPFVYQTTAGTDISDTLLNFEDEIFWYDRVNDILVKCAVDEWACYTIAVTRAGKIRMVYPNSFLSSIGAPPAEADILGVFADTRARLDYLEWAYLGVFAVNGSYAGTFTVDNSFFVEIPKGSNVTISGGGTGLPDATISNKGDILEITNTTGSNEWSVIAPVIPRPDPLAVQPGYVPMVDSSGTNVEWSSLTARMNVNQNMIAMGGVSGTGFVEAEIYQDDAQEAMISDYSYLSRSGFVMENTQAANGFIKLAPSTGQTDVLNIIFDMQKMYFPIGAKTPLYVQRINENTMRLYIEETAVPRLKMDTPRYNDAVLSWKGHDNIITDYNIVSNMTTRILDDALLHASFKERVSVETLHNKMIQATAYGGVVTIDPKWGKTFSLAYQATIANIVFTEPMSDGQVMFLSLKRGNTSSVCYFPADWVWTKGGAPATSLFSVNKANVIAIKRMNSLYLAEHIMRNIEQDILQKYPALVGISIDNASLSFFDGTGILLKPSENTTIVGNTISHAIYKNKVSIDRIASRKVDLTIVNGVLTIPLLVDGARVFSFVHDTTIQSIVFTFGPDLTRAGMRIKLIRIPGTSTQTDVPLTNCNVPANQAVIKYGNTIAFSDFQTFIDNTVYYLGTMRGA